MRSTLSFLALLVTALSAVFGVSAASAAPALSSHSTCWGVGGYAFVTSDSKVYGNGGYLFSSETGFVGCASNSSGICAWKADGSAKCTNSQTYSNVEWISNAWGGNYSALLDPYYFGWIVRHKDGTFSKFSGSAATLWRYSSATQWSVVSTAFDSAANTDGYSWIGNEYGSTVATYSSTFQAFQTQHWGGDSNSRLATDGTFYYGWTAVQSSVMNIGAGHWYRQCVLSDAFIVTCYWDSALNSNAPTYPVRDVFVSADTDWNWYGNSSEFRFFAVRKSDNKVVWWDASNAPTELTSAPAPVSSGGTSSEYCIESPTSSGSYVFTPIVSSSLSFTDSSWFGIWKEYETDSWIKYRIKGLSIEAGSYFTGALLNTNTEGSAFFAEPDSVANTAGNAYVEISVSSGSINFLRLFGDSDWVVRYSAIFEVDGERTYQYLYERSTFGKYLKYEWDKKLVGWRLEFPNNGRLVFRNFEIGTFVYQTVSVTRSVCYSKAEYEQIHNYGSGSTGSGWLGSIAVWMSTYIGLVNGGSFTGTYGEAFEQVFSGSSDYHLLNPPEYYSKPVTSYYTVCEAPVVDLWNYSFLSWGTSWTIPVIDYSYDFHPFSGIECPLRLAVSVSEKIKSAFYNSQ